MRWISLLNKLGEPYPGIFALRPIRAVDQKLHFILSEWISFLEILLLRSTSKCRISFKSVRGSLRVDPTDTASQSALLLCRLQRLSYTDTVQRGLSLLKRKKRYIMGIIKTTSARRKKKAKCCKDIAQSEMTSVERERKRKEAKTSHPHPRTTWTKPSQPVSKVRVGAQLHPRHDAHLGQINLIRNLRRLD